MTIASQLAGTIVNVPVTDNEVVPAGAVLVEIDPRDYTALLAQAKAHAFFLLRPEQGRAPAGAH